MMRFPSPAIVVLKSNFASLVEAFAGRVSPPLFRGLLGALVLCAVLGHCLQYFEIDLLRRLEASLYDARVRLFARLPVDERIVIVDIDERSLAERGRWPWNRARMAELIDSLFDRYGVRLVGLDVILAEADDSSGLNALEALGRGALRADPAFREALEALRPELDYDGRLAESLRRHPVVLGFHLSSGVGAVRSGVLPSPIPVAGAFGDRVLPWLPSWTGYAGNLPVLQAAAEGAGFLTAPVDVDGVTRRAWLLAAVDGKTYAALPLAMAQVLIGSTEMRTRFAEQPGSKTVVAPLEALELTRMGEPVAIPVDQQGRVLLPFRGPEGSFPYVSATDVLAGRLPPDSLRGRIVFLGTTAPGLLDQRVTPLAESYPGVEAHANLLSALLDGTVLRTPPYAPGLEAVVLLLAGLVLLFGLPRLSPVWTVVLTIGLLTTLTAFNMAAWSLAHVVFPLAATWLLLPSLFFLHLFFGYFVERRAKRRLAELFGQYVPPELVDEMSRDPTHYNMEGRSVEMTVLFADVRGFTALAEGMPPGDLARLMNDYFSSMTDVIRRHRGTLDKYIGDAVVAFWGAPLPDPEHARHAVSAGVEMQAELIAVNRRFAARGWPALRIGIGINTGTMVVGDMGSRHRRSYTVLGDAVNLASRLEGLSVHYDAGVIIGEATRRQVSDWPCRTLGSVTVRGRTAPVVIYEPLVT